MIQAPVYSAVRVTDETLERNGQVGVIVGPGDLPGETSVKFEDAAHDGKQVVETFEDKSLTPVA